MPLITSGSNQFVNSEGGVGADICRGGIERDHSHLFPVYLVSMSTCQKGTNFSLGFLDMHEILCQKQLTKVMGADNV